MTHRIEIKIEAPVADASKTNYRTTVFSVSMESELTVTKIQQLTTKMFTELTELAVLNGKTS